MRQAEFASNYVNLTVLGQVLQYNILVLTHWQITASAAVKSCKNQWVLNGNLHG